MLYLTSDHGGFELKAKIKDFLSREKIDFVDLGPERFDPKDDYPEFAHRLARAIKSGSDRGIIICRSGQGTAITVNRHSNIRAIVAFTPEMAEHGRADNDSNVLSLGADYLNADQASEIIKVWLATPFSGKQRHQKRIAQIDQP